MTPESAMNDQLHLNVVLFDYFTEIEKERIQRDVAHKNVHQPPEKKRKTMLEIILNND
jgi:hypothetical protein